jgi:hypothetical protein
MRLYTVTFNGVAVTASQDLFEVVAPADTILVVHDIHVSQLSEVKDAEEEELLLLWKSGQTTTGSGGSTPTAIPIEFKDPAFGGTVKANNTTKATAGTIVTHHSWHWNVRMPFDRIFTPETRPVISPSRRATLELATVVADSITMGGTLTFASIG